MKINPLHSVNAYRKQQEVNVQKTSSISQKRDQVQISSAAKKMQQSTQISAERQEKLNQIKEKIDSGTYEVKPKEVARKFYEFWDK
ncbi:negative regulator of flagellin synthesis FlgM [Evansella vedderi]|uniref:Negative regulator of flagellin synthesis n=1 Tax=Evansella vedderi TaxID=38282 RepID=A0ABT9ZTF4_9BACI|nr:flagellar biosynthesis anti-sigma factor FlgM [Evansella vedderi]MDQ0254526.1 negative regulator of flagellin synthesis FlgM [Evansella vedderi]